ncbi:hypothetical protein B0T10DRAFT_487255 [Thelonectria olida]|uniref:Pentatricopeptide repeat domain-containing protein n=1 Tax=Thelonectria olida TaxID=1576542 RepID=A0A9P9AQS0_9HYPO|nr:hypothetical protein B0T10DRAFT_487255 [Thelonectria olida]
MHRTLRRIRYAQSSPRIPTDLRFNDFASSRRTRRQSPTALVFPSVAPYSAICRLFFSGAISSTKQLRLWSSATSKQLEWSKDGGLGQGESHDAPQSQFLGEPMNSRTLSGNPLQQYDHVPEPQDTALTAPRELDLRNRHGVDAAWDCFLELRGRADFFPIVDPRAEYLRNKILIAALDDANRMTVFYEVAQHLRDEFNFEWPELYPRVIHHYLGHAEYDTAHLWHLRLMPTFTPSVNEFGALLASFAVDPSRELQLILRKLYTLSPLRKIYDHLIPTLFEYGQSRTARVWRKFLILYGDFPCTSRSRPFLEFCSRYYPTGLLSGEELAIIRQDSVLPIESKEPTPSKSAAREPKGIYGDSFTARWFASSWASVEFAIDLMHKLGFKTIGPKSLQSLALRESDAEGVANCIAQLEELGITIALTTYCIALVTFAKEGRQDLLTDLIHCDIHPEEFDDPETRRMLMLAAKRYGDENRERLLREVEHVVFGQPEAEEQPSTPPLKATDTKDLNNLLKKALAKKALSRGRLILNEMESSNISLSQANAAKILGYTFEGLWFFPKKKKQKYFGKGRDPQLDRAIQMARQVSKHEVAVPIRCWRILLYNLGRLGRFHELEELSHEIVDLYAFAPEGLIPVYRFDMPPMSEIELKSESKQAMANESRSRHKKARLEAETDEEGWLMFTEDFWGQEMGLDEPEARPHEKSTQSKKLERRTNLQEIEDEAHYIPTDLPLSHQQHPIMKLFDPVLQRAVVRWGFDQKLALPSHHDRAIVPVMAASSADFDIAWGVRFLATLREKGVHIDPQVLRSTLYARINVGQVPGRGRHRSRDERELAPANLKRLIDDAWGSELLPALPLFITQLEEQKPKIWDRYSRLFLRAYDPEGVEEMNNERRSKSRQERSKVTW